MSKADRIRRNEERKQMAAFCKERDAALLSMDKATIMAFVEKWHVEWPDAVKRSDALFWVVVHKTFCKTASLPLVARRRSAKWLRDHGFTDIPGGL